MRDTIIWGISLAAVAWGVFQLSHPSRMALEPTKQTKQLGAKDARAKNRASFQNGDPAESERITGEDPQAAPLPSIYSQSSSEEPQKRRTVGFSKKKVSRIAGMDSESYVALQQNRIRTSDVPEKNEEHLRLYVMCVEVKEGQVESQSVGDCRALYQDSVALKMRGNNRF